ncbi:MAG: tetratricopeptide repeat protein [Cytophagaceae bacterium]|nr:tetratricopeptide repeat protein [Cytophagaceae bacterium]
MNNPRLQKLQVFYEQDPNDPFNLYALTLEYLKSDRSTARIYFEKLIRDFADYLPTYYQAAQFFAEEGDVKKAKETYERGMAVAEIAGQEKVLRELRGAYRQWLDEWEGE